MGASQSQSKPKPTDKETVVQSKDETSPEMQAKITAYLSYPAADGWEKQIFDHQPASDETASDARRIYRTYVIARCHSIVDEEAVEALIMHLLRHRGMARYGPLVVERHCAQERFVLVNVLLNIFAQAPEYVDVNGGDDTGASGLDRTIAAMNSNYSTTPANIRRLLVRYIGLCNDSLINGGCGWTPLANIVRETMDPQANSDYDPLDALLKRANDDGSGLRVQTHGQYVNCEHPDHKERTSTPIFMGTAIDNIAILKAAYAEQPWRMARLETMEAKINAVGDRRIRFRKMLPVAVEDAIVGINFTKSVAHALTPIIVGFLLCPTCFVLKPTVL